MWFLRFWKSPVSCFQPSFLKERRALSCRRPKPAPTLGPLTWTFHRVGACGVGALRSCRFEPLFWEPRCSSMG